jgi:hypothetical protein
MPRGIPERRRSRVVRGGRAMRHETLQRHGKERQENQFSHRR